MSSFPICLFESRDFCRINFIVLSSLQKFSIKLFTLDHLSASLSLRGMMLEITTLFLVHLALYASSVVFSTIASGESFIFRLFFSTVHSDTLGLLLTAGIA